MTEETKPDMRRQVLVLRATKPINQEWLREARQGLNRALSSKSPAIVIPHDFEVMIWRVEDPEPDGEPAPERRFLVLPMGGGVGGGDDA